MSSAGAHGHAAAAAVPQRYFCHQCNRTVVLTPDPHAEISCPICHGGFVEEFDPPSNNPFISFSSPLEPLFSPAAPFPLVFSTSSSFDLRNPSDLAGLFGQDPSPRGGGAAEQFNPLAFLQNYLGTLMAGGANIQVVLEGGPATGASIGDYFVGPRLEQLIQQLAENDPNRYGTPPASKPAVQALPDVVITVELLASDEAQCAVCKDTFEIGAVVKQMPCKHIYHKDCILPWLALHNSCPVCRYELPTDDADYEQRRGAPAPSAATEGNSGGSGGTGLASGDGNSPGHRNVERRFRISLPWPLRMFGSQTEASNAGAGGNSDVGATGGNADSGGSEHSQPETRQEDLD